MKENWQESLKHILKYEGGYVNHKDDPGGMTNLGVTKRVWEDWNGKPATEAAMRGSLWRWFLRSTKNGIGMLFAVTIFLLGSIFAFLIALSMLALVGLVNFYSKLLE